MVKFLNSERAKAEARAEAAWSEADREALVQENEQLRRRNAALAEMVGEYALRVAELEVRIKELQPHLTPSQQAPAVYRGGEEVGDG